MTTMKGRTKDERKNEEIVYGAGVVVVEVVGGALAVQQRAAGHASGDQGRVVHGRAGALHDLAHLDRLQQPYACGRQRRSSEPPPPA